MTAAPKRIPWTTSRIHGSPDPPKPFVAQRIFPKLEFKEALEIVFEPDCETLVRAGAERQNFLLAARR